MARLSSRSGYAYLTYCVVLCVALFGCGEPLKVTETQTASQSGRPEVEHKNNEATSSDELQHLITSLNFAIDTHRNDVETWANVTRINRSNGTALVEQIPYGDTDTRNDFWPASTIKMFTATAGLELLSGWGFSIDSTATFYQQTANGQWVEDVSMTFRELIRRTFDCSSNITYTLLLRLAGVDWLNEDFFPRYGMHNTALMRGYVPATERPYGYQLGSPQRIVITDGDRQIERTHQYGWVSHAENAGCSIWNETGMGNCTSPVDMSEHLRRIMMHDELPPSERFSIRDDLMDWYRGRGTDLVLNNVGGDDCGGPVFEGIRRVFASPQLFHKEGLVSSYRGSVHYVKDEPSQTEYLATVMIKSPDARLLSKVSEEIARVVRDKGTYLHLDTLKDDVNPITADLMINANQAGYVEVKLKPYDEPAYISDGWFTPAGFTTSVERGLNSYRLISSCQSDQGVFHVMATLKSTDGSVIARSDLHYVIIGSALECGP